MRFRVVMLILAIHGVFGLHGQEKYALVIGNSTYAAYPALANPLNDARDVSETLKILGFKVDMLLDADLAGMESATDRFGANLKASPDTVGFFFYAGHGVQSQGENYLLPVDADIRNANSLRQRAYSTQMLYDTLQQSRNRLNVIILDACRDLPAAWSRSANRGLSVVARQPAGSIIVYSTSAGSTAADGEGRNGLFTGNFLKYLPVPGIDIQEVFRRTGEAVVKESRSEQVPAVYNQYFGSMCLSGTPGAPGGGQEGQSWSEQAIPPGNVRISLASEATIEFDGKSRKARSGTTTTISGVSPGSHMVRILYADSTSETRQVSVTSGAWTDISFDHVPRKAKPSGTRVPVSMKDIEGGTFRMGDESLQGDSNERPVHLVSIHPFRLGITEVTQEQWFAVMGTTPGRFKGNRLPVEQVSWFDAVHFCNALSEAEGLEPAYVIDGTSVEWNQDAEGYRLPTEAEWEYAARGGSGSPAGTWSGSDNPDLVAWTQDNSRNHTNDVASRKAGALGLFDLSGNVSEWCWDWDSAYSTLKKVCPTGPSSGTGRIIRGGSWGQDTFHARITCRDSNKPTYANSDLGFRVARNK